VADLRKELADAVKGAVDQDELQDDWRIDDVGNGAATVWLVRTSHSVDHYLATRPAGDRGAPLAEVGDSIKRN
jgi:hypothetical protein